MRIRQKLIFLRHGNRRVWVSIGARHDGYQVVYKVLVHHVVSHSRPASVRVTFVSFNELLYCFVTRDALIKPRGDRGTALVRGIRFQFLSLTGLFWFSYQAVSRGIAFL